MNPEEFERQKTIFLGKVEQASQSTGVTFSFDAIHEQHGGSHLIKPVVSVVPIAGWQAPVDNEVDDGDSSVK